MNQELHGILHSRGGFITRSKRSGPTKIGKRRTAVNYKKRGHKKTQKRRFLALWGGTKKKQTKGKKEANKVSKFQRPDFRSYKNIIHALDANKLDIANATMSMKKSSKNTKPSEAWKNPPTNQGDRRDLEHFYHYGDSDDEPVSQKHNYERMSVRERDESGIHVAPQKASVIFK